MDNKHGSEIKAVLKRSSDLKKSKPMDGGNVSVDVCTHGAEEVQQFHMFGTPDIDEKKNIDSVIRYICPLEGTEQGNVPVSPESKFSGVVHTPRTSAMRLRSQTRMRHLAYDRPVLWQQNKRSAPVGQEHLGCDGPAPRDVSQ